uniref:Uncharacterized protein n=1 Tax=Anguilla anguilla TaxID=7936 RepID=A0A0E9SW52_ANGAN
MMMKAHCRSNLYKNRTAYKMVKFNKRNQKVCSQCSK